MADEDSMRKRQLEEWL
ncbi:hypothetical protein BN1723_021068, partial [Verticillium longisporum]